MSQICHIVRNRGRGCSCGVRILTFLESSVLNKHFVLHSWSFKETFTSVRGLQLFSFMVTLFHECNHIYSYICICMLIQTYAYIATEIHMYAYAYIYMYACVRVYVCMNIYINSIINSILFKFDDGLS